MAIGWLRSEDGDCGEFSEGDMLSPRSRVRATEDPKIGFYFLVHMFSFPISLRVVGSGKGKFITEEFAQFFGEGGGELWSLIRDDFVIETKSCEDL